jgi:catechol 2,3-dioxygenase-like lactoylglutathione lyase family enzyme
MTSKPRPQLTHVGVFVRDIEKMTAFYRDVMGLTVTDQGDISGDRKIVFMSNDPDEHHQFVLISGRADDDAMLAAQQLSFLVDTLDDVRTLHDKVSAAGMEITQQTCHGNALSVYFKDPDGNRVEIYTHTPWHITQPHAVPIDLSQSNAEILAWTEAHCREDTSFMSAEERSEQMAKMMGHAR